ncbi:hypothetical protein C2845_PM18G05080 [Panicum miliaceum]|uniref:F-box domain-containing protein n=1 Tax=Panicum miliaceum TaxID=4540 RepID=A0A3L6PJG6_PANMI|nr:hypothetical protein C2845_PM18G05080 [Panicum miliaceum]
MATVARSALWAAAAGLEDDTRSSSAQQTAAGPNPKQARAGGYKMCALCTQMNLQPNSSIVADLPKNPIRLPEPCRRRAVPDAPTVPRPTGYRRGWLPRCSCSDDGAHGSDAGGGAALLVPDDALSPVFARLSTAADVVRCAATCRRWSCLVAKDAAVLSRAVPPLPCLTLGFLHQEHARAIARRRRTSSFDAAQPRFVPTAAAARLIGLRGPSWTALADAVLAAGDRRGLFEHARPVAGRNGWLVLELSQERYTDGVKLCPLSAFFRLLLVYNRRGFTALCSYSSDTGRWSRETTRSGGPKIASHRLRQLGQSIVVGGVAYWHLRRTAFAVRLDTLKPAEVRMPRSGIPADPPPGWAADGKLMFIDAALGADIDPALGADYNNAAVCSHHLTVATRAVFCPSSGDDGCSGEWERTKGCIRLKQLKVRYQGSREEKVLPVAETKINLRWFSFRWFCEKSGNLLFTLGEGTANPGAYVPDMATQHVEKVADDIDCHSWENFVGYEMDGAAYLQSITRH